MLAHEINNGYEQKFTAPDTTEGVHLSTRAADTLSGIFNMDPTQFASIDSLDKLRKFVYEPVAGSQESLYEALDESIPGLMQTHVVDLAHGKEVKVERDRNGFYFARTYAPHITAWTNATSSIVVPHASYTGLFSAENGKFYNVGGAMRSDDPRQVSGFCQELLKELREIEIGLSLQEFQDQDIEEARMKIASELLDITKLPGFSTDYAELPLEYSLYDRAGVFLGAKQLDWLLDENPNGVKIRHDSGFTRISYHQTDKYKGHYLFELGQNHDYNGQHYELMRDWFTLGRNYVMKMSYMPTSGPQAGRHLEAILDNDQEGVAQFKYEVRAALNQVVAELGVSC